MTQVENVAVPFVMIGNVQALTCQQIEENLELKEFVNRFPNCFELDINYDCYKFYPDGNRRVCDGSQLPILQRHILGL